MTAFSPLSPMLAAVLTLSALGSGCQNVSGELDGTEFGTVRTILYGETDLDNESAMTVLISDYPFRCEDLTQIWTPDEVEAFPELNMLMLLIGDADEGEYEVDADDNDDASEAWFIRYEEGLEYEWDEDLFLSEDGQVTIDSLREQQLMTGEFDLDMELAAGGEDGNLQGSFRAEFCRNLSYFEGSASLIGSLF